MVKIDKQIFGYRRILIAPGDIPKAASILMRRGIGVDVMSSGEIIARERDIASVRTCLSGIDHSVSDLLGIPGAFKRTKYKKGIMIGAIIGLLMIVFSSFLVWDIRIEGNSALPEAAVIYSLSEAGFSIGDIWSEKDLSAIEAKLLLFRDDISWVNINRRGSVAYVEIRERGKSEDEQDGESSGVAGFSNIVASKAGVVEEITVNSGMAAVSVGDVVKAGDILIMGVLPEEAGGGFCKAEGRVYARVYDSVCTEVSKKQEYFEISSRKINKISLKFFKFNINIFKRYGKVPDDCDIIEQTDPISLFDRAALPASITIERRVNYKKAFKSLGDDELVSISSQRHTRALSERLISSDLLKIKTKGEFIGNSYRMTSELVLLEQIGSVP